MSRTVMLLTFFWVQSLYAQNSREPFYVSTEGLRGEREALQVKAELQMARDTRYCRGAMIPSAVKSWSCETRGPGVERCEREYRCARIRPDFSRLTETRKLIERQRQLGAVSGEHKIQTRPEVKVSQVALPAANATLTKERGIPLREESQKSAEIVVGRTRPAVDQQRVQETQTIDPILNFREQDSSQMTLTTDWTDEQELREMMAETPASRERTKTTQNKTTEKKTKDSGESGFQFLRAAVTYLQAKDDFGESQSTFDLAWIPRYRFGNGFALRAQLGFHQYTIPLVVEETFMVIDTFALVQYTFWEKWTVEAGLGQQKWSSEYLGGVGGMMLGVGYELGHRWLDTISLQTTSLSGGEEGGVEEKISELRFSFALQF